MSEVEPAFTVPSLVELTWGELAALRVVARADSHRYDAVIGNFPV